jgi:hypothetical protein
MLGGLGCPGGIGVFLHGRSACSLEKNAGWESSPAEYSVADRLIPERSFDGSDRNEGSSNGRRAWQAFLRGNSPRSTRKTGFGTAEKGYFAMPRLLFACVVLGVAAAAGGCAMCSDGYDHCGPTYRDGGYGPNARSGSILSGGAAMEATYLEEVPAEEGVPTLAPALESSPNDAAPAPIADPSVTSKVPVGQVGPLLTREEIRAGAKILSVTDHKLEELQAQQNQESIAAAAAPAKLPPTATRQSSSSGWTSRR